MNGGRKSREPLKRVKNDREGGDPKSCQAPWGGEEREDEDHTKQGNRNLN